MLLNIEYFSELSEESYLNLKVNKKENIALSSNNNEIEINSGLVPIEATTENLEIKLTTI